MNFINHLKTVNEHRREVRRGCFSVGLFYQGLTHDLSKYSPEEFLVGIKYYQGTESPNNGERRKIGYSSAWLHHKGRNKHHFEYWTDYSMKVKGKSVPVRMPTKYIVEMYMDRVAASKIYNKERYQDDFPLKYYQKGKDYITIEEHTNKELEKLLKMLAKYGEEETAQYIRRVLLRGNVCAALCEVIYCIKRRYGK